MDTASDAGSTRYWRAKTLDSKVIEGCRVGCTLGEILTGLVIRADGPVILTGEAGAGEGRHSVVLGRGGGGEKQGRHCLLCPARNGGWGKM